MGTLCTSGLQKRLHFDYFDYRGQYQTDATELAHPVALSLLVAETKQVQGLFTIVIILFAQRSVHSLQIFFMTFF